MPVTFYPSDVEPRCYQGPATRSHFSSENVLKGSLESGLVKTVDEILQSSFPSQPLFDQATKSFPMILPRPNGFVETVIDAYNGHQALEIRPDDVWLAILGQFNLYVNGHAEELRDKFVSHTDKRELLVTAIGTAKTVDFGALAAQMTDLIHENIIDKDLQAWILPEFTTTTATDVVVASVTMMAALKQYFDYSFGLCVCGIPKVTLAGERADWEMILDRIDKLREYGPLTTRWCEMLRPVLSRFVRAFDDGFAESEENKAFWQRVAHREGGGCIPSLVSGWITAFYAFDRDGAWIDDAQVGIDSLW
jgi:hypothetical protein